MPASQKSPGQSIRRQAMLLALPVLALVVFGFISLRWEKKAHEEELRSRCQTLAEPLRREFFSRLAEVDLLRKETLSGDIDSIPSPAEGSESLARFQEEEYQAVLGEAGALSETGLPLRPLAAIRLIRKEVDPKRLAELAAVIATEPSFITIQLLREAEDRHQQLGIPLPPVLNDWEERLKRTSRVNKILAGREPENLLSATDTSLELESENGPVLAIRTPGGVSLTDKTTLEEITRTSLTVIADALPSGVTAEIQIGYSHSDLHPTIAIDSASPPIHFVITDAEALHQSSSQRRALFAAFLVIAAILSGAGMLALFRTVTRERELAERKGNLVAAVSHEMRTPVASIRLLAENLSTGAADTEERRTNHLGQLLEQSERLSTLVENVLSFSKRGAGHAKWKTEPIDIDRLLDHSTSQFEALAESKEVTLNWSAGEFPRSPKGDSPALEQALANLIDNALKHSPRGSKIRIEADPASTHLTGWCLRVTDSGPGVPKEERNKVFEAFYRIGPELRRETKGTGLGLALVQQVAEAHSGEALCLDSDSKGARFELHLPYSPPNLNS